MADHTPSVSRRFGGSIPLRSAMKTKETPLPGSHRVNNCPKPWHRGEQHESKCEVLDANGSLLFTIHGGIVSGPMYPGKLAQQIVDAINGTPAMQKPLPEFPEPPQNVLVKENEDKRRPVGR